jgi:hypothetical protein
MTFSNGAFQIGNETIKIIAKNILEEFSKCLSSNHHLAFLYTRVF